MKWTIFSKNGEAKHESLTQYNGDGRVVYQDSLEYTGNWMGETFLTVSIKSAYPIDFQIGDYIDYRGERFTINYDPTVIKKARRGTYGEGFTYDSIKFNSYSNELTEVMFHDWVLSDNELHYTSLPNFSFHCKDVDDLVDRLQANMDRWCKANGRKKEDYWLFYTLKSNPSGTKDAGQKQTTYERTQQRAKDILESCGITDIRSTEYTSFLDNVKSQWEKTFGVDAKYRDSRDDERYDRNLQANNQTVWDLMASIKQQFGLSFIIRGKNVYIGTAGVPTAHLFKYGKGNGLYEVDRTADQDQKVVTKLHAYGSNENMPTRYYVTIHTEPYAKVMEVSAKTENPETEGTILDLFETDFPFSDRYFTRLYKAAESGETLSNIFEVKIKIDNYLVGALAEKNAVTENTRMRVDWSNGAGLNEGNKENVIGFTKALKAGGRVIFEAGVNKSAVPSSNLLSTTPNKLPNNMAVTSLMLPGFPDYALSEVCRSVYDNVKDVTNYYIKQTPSSAETLFYTESGEHLIEFSKDKYDPYLLSSNAAVLGIKEGDISCTEENDDNGLEAVYPTIEETTDIEAGVGTSGARLDAVVIADFIDDNGAWPTDKTDKIPPFYIYLPELGFDLQQANEDAGGGDMQISMKNGFCGGRTFRVAEARRVGKDDSVQWKAVLANANYFNTKYNKNDWPADQPYLVRNLPIKAAWRLKCQRVEDSGQDLYFPYSYPASIKGAVSEQMTNAYQIMGGDNYVITGIKVGDVNYVKTASWKLLRKAIHWLCKNDHTRYVYSPKIDEIFMARQDEEAKNDTTGTKVSLHDTLKEGDVLLFSDDDLLLKGAVYIEQLQIKENGNNGIPTYEVTLRDETEVSSLQRLQNKVDSLATDVKNGNVGNAWNTTQLASLFSVVGKDYFLSKTDDDTAAGNITFRKDINIGGTASTTNIDNAGSISNAGDIKNRGNIENKGDIVNAGGITTRDLTVTGLAHFFSLTIDEIKATGGAFLATPASGFTADIVEAINDSKGNPAGWRLYWRAEQNGKTIMNTWRTGDMAICQTFNVGKGTTYNAANKKWWRLVTATSNENASAGFTYTFTFVFKAADAGNGAVTKIDPNTGTECLFHWIEVSNKSGEYMEGSDIPAAEDEVAQLGYQGKEDEDDADIHARQSAIYYSAYSSIDSELKPPFFAFYEGIRDFKDLKDYRTSYKDANKMVVFGEVHLQTGDGKYVPAVTERGEYNATTQYYKYDRVSYDGSLWLCVKETGAKGVTPDADSEYWLRQVSKGTDGKAGSSVYCQYSVDGDTWVNEAKSGVVYRYIRTSTDGKTWTAATRLQGDNGKDGLAVSLTPSAGVLGMNYDPLTDTPIIIYPHLYQGNVDRISECTVTYDGGDALTITTSDTASDKHGTIAKITDNNRKVLKSAPNGVVKVTISYPYDGKTLSFVCYWSYSMATSGLDINDTNATLYTQYVTDSGAVKKAEMGTLVDSGGKTIVKLSGDQIALEGYTTINGNTKIDTSGNLITKNAMLDGYLRSSVNVDWGNQTRQNARQDYVVEDTLNIMTGQSTNQIITNYVHLPLDPEYIGARVIIIASPAVDNTGFISNSNKSVYDGYTYIDAGKVWVKHVYVDAENSTTGDSGIDSLYQQPNSGEATAEAAFNNIASTWFLGGDRVTDAQGGIRYPNQIKFRGGIIELLGIQGLSTGMVSNKRYKYTEDKTAIAHAGGAWDTRGNEDSAYKGKTVNLAQWVVVNAQCSDIEYSYNPPQIYS